MATLPLISDPELDARIADEDAGFGALETAAGALPLTAMDVRACITGLSYELILEQTFVNALDQPLEATYVYPLPSRAAVCRFRLKVGDRVIDGVLKERGEARREYAQAIRDGHRAALAEEDRSSVFSIKVGNIMAGEEARVELVVNGQLTYADGEAELRFPLVVAPRYVPGRDLAGISVGDGVAVDTDQVPDASRISPPVLLPGFPNPVRLSLEVSLDGAGLSVRDVRSSLHAVASEPGDGEEGVTVVRLHPGERLNRDFVLRFDVAEAEVRSSLAVVEDDEAGSGTFVLTLVPPAHSARAAPPRDVVFVLDRSGSMSGWKMVCARRALGRMVDTLTNRDAFTVLAFDNVIERAPGHQAGRLVPAADRARFRAVEWLGSVDARGGTEMEEPLVEAVGLLAGSRPEREGILVLVTDGQVAGEDRLLRRLGSSLRSIRVFTLGIDRAVNEGFLRRLAEQGGGGCELVEGEDRLDEVMERTHRRIASPLLTEVGVRLDGAELEPQSLSPARLPDLFAGAPAFISGRYRDRRGRLAAEVTARAGASAWCRRIAGRERGGDLLRRLWARTHLRDLEDRFAAGQRDLEARIVEVSLRHGVLCRFTAFVAVDRSEKVNVGGEVERILQPVEAPEGWAMLQAGHIPPAAPSPEDGVLMCAFEPEGKLLEAPRAMTGSRFPGGDARPSAAARVRSRGGLLGRLTRRHSEPEPTPRPQPDLDSVAGCAAASADLLERFRKALERGTDGLAHALWTARAELEELGRGLRLIGAEADAADRLLEAAEELGRLPKPPGSEVTVRLWRDLEPALEELASRSS